ENLILYATVGSSWRPGAHAIGDFSLTRSARENAFIDLSPEKSKSYEIGIKSTFLQNRAHLSVSYFHQDFDGYLYRGPGVYYVSTDLRGTALVQSVKTFNFTANVPVKVDGFEIEASVQPVEHWSISGNFSYANGRIK